MAGYFLKPCPFCGEEAILKRVQFGNNNYGHIQDTFEVSCKNRCCSMRRVSKIFLDEEGHLVIEANGAKNAAEAWNTRKENNHELT